MTEFSNPTRFQPLLFGEPTSQHLRDLGLNGRKRKEHLVSVSLLFGGIWVVRNAPEDLDGIGSFVRSSAKSSR